MADDIMTNLLALNHSAAADAADELELLRDIVGTLLANLAAATKRVDRAEAQVAELLPWATGLVTLPLRLMSGQDVVMPGDASARAALIARIEAGEFGEI